MTQQGKQTSDGSNQLLRTPFSSRALSPSNVERAVWLWSSRLVSSRLRGRCSHDNAGAWTTNQLAEHAEQTGMRLSNTGPGQAARGPLGGSRQAGDRRRGEAIERHRQRRAGGLVWTRSKSKGWPSPFQRPRPFVSVSFVLVFFDFLRPQPAASGKPQRQLGALLRQPALPCAVLKGSGSLRAHGEDSAAAAAAAAVGLPCSSRLSAV